MKIRYLIEKSCEHGYFGKHITDYDDAGDTFCLTKPVVLEADEWLVERIAAPIIEALYQLVDIEVEPSDWDASVDRAARGVLAALIPAEENR